MGCGASSAKNVEETQKPIESNEKRIEVAKKQKEDVVVPTQESNGVQKVEKPHPKEDQEKPHVHEEQKDHSLPPKKVKQKEEDEKPVTPEESPEPPRLNNPGEEEENFENVEYGDEEHKAASLIQRRFKEHSTKKKISRMLVCYTCGQKFGPTSLPIHLRDCPGQRLNDYKANLPKELVPKSLPKPPTAPIPHPENGTQQEVDTYNEQAQEIFSKYSLIRCPICERGFECDRLTKHLKSCKDKDGNTWERQQAARTIQTNWKKHTITKMLFCYCCGQEYGTKSLPIHIPECIEKRKSYWAHSGLPEDLIKNVPEPPVLPIPGSNDPIESFKSYNTEARIIYLASMAQCPGCNRKFEPDSMTFGIDEASFSVSSELNLFPEKDGSLSSFYFDPTTMKIYSFGGYDGINSHQFIQSSTVSFINENSPLLIKENSMSFSHATLTGVDSFSVIGELPRKIYGYAFHILNINGIDYAYIFGGGSSNIMRANLNNLTSFSVLNEQLPYSFSFGVSFRTERKLFVIGGSSTFEFSKAVYMAPLDSPTTWEKVGTFPQSTFGASVISVGRMIYIIGGGFGVENAYNTIYYASFDLLDVLSPSNSSSIGFWSLSNNVLPKPIFASAQFISSNYAYLISGSLGLGMIRASLNDMTLWENVPSFSSPYSALGISFLSVGNSVLFAGGLPTTHTSTSIGYLMNVTHFKNCFGVSYINSMVCSGKGYCIGSNLCSCFPGFYGDACQYESKCEGISASSPSVCSGNGNCNFKCGGVVSIQNTYDMVCSDTCSCEDGFSGLSCEVYSCWGVSNNETNVCSGNGICTNIDTCECKSTKNVYYYGRICELYEEENTQISSLTIIMEYSQVIKDEGMVLFKIGSNLDSPLVSYRVWCSNCTDYTHTSFETSLVVESSDISLDIFKLKTEYSYVFVVQGVWSDGKSKDILSNIVSTILYIPKMEILPENILITHLETSKLPLVIPFTKQLGVFILLSQISFNYPEGVDFLLNDCIGFTLDSSCQLNYITKITVYNTSNWRTPVKLFENTGSIVVQRNRDISSIQLNPVLTVNVSDPFPNIELTAFNDGSELAFYIEISVLSEKHSFSTFEKSQISFLITKPATYPINYLERVVLSPKEGMSVVDTFSVSTPEWNVNNMNLMPLSYAFGFYNPFLDTSTNDSPSHSSLFRVTEYASDPNAKLPLPFLFKSLSRNVYSTTAIVQIVIFVKDAQGHEQSLPIAKAKVNPLSIALSSLNEHSRFVLAFDQSALQNRNNTNLILNLIGNVNIDLSNADTTLQMLNSISSEISLMSDKNVLNQLSSTVSNFLSNTLDLYQGEIKSYGFVKSSLGIEAKLSAISLLSNIFGSSSSSITVNQKGILLVDNEMQQIENMILSFTKLMLKSEIPKVLSMDSDVTILPLVKFSTSGLNTTFSSFVLTASSRSLKNSSTINTKFLLETDGGNIQLDLKEIVAKYSGFGVPLGLSLLTFERNVRNDNFSMNTQMSSIIQELKYFQDGQVVKLDQLQNPIDLQFSINEASRGNLTLDPKIVSSNSQLLNQTFSINGNETVELLNITTTTIETPIISCLYWDETLMKWSDYGCSLDFYNNITGIAQCSCTHTTKFSTFLQYERRNMTTTLQQYINPKPNVFNPPPLDHSFILSIQYFQMAVGLIYSVLSMVLLFLLSIYRKQQPVKSRMITPFLGIIAMLMESILSSILQKGLFVFELIENSTDLMSVNIVGNICMVIVNTLNITAIVAYLIQVIRFQFMKELYERIKHCRQDSNRKMINSLKFITSPITFTSTVVSCLILNVIIWSVFVILVRMETIPPPLYIRITSMTYAGIILSCFFIILITIIIDFTSALRMKETTSLNRNSSRIIQLTIASPENHKTEHYNDIPSPRVSLSIERENIMFRILHLDNPLYFRMEMVLFLVCFICCIIQMISGILVEEFSKDSNTQLVHYYLMIQCVFETIYSGIYLFVFGGFSLLILLKFKRDNSLNSQNVETFEQTELIETLQDPIGFNLFEDFSKKEFSLENLYLFIELFHNKSIVMGEYLPLLPVFMDRIYDNFLSTGSLYEVNIPSQTKKLFTELHQYVSAKRVELLSFHPISHVESSSHHRIRNFDLNHMIGSETHKHQPHLHSLSEEEEKHLTSRIVTCFDSLTQQVLINMNDTYYRFVTTLSYKNYNKNREMIRIMAKQANVMAWQEPINTMV